MGSEVSGYDLLELGSMKKCFSFPIIFPIKSLDVIFSPSSKVIGILSVAKVRVLVSTRIKIMVLISCFIFVFFFILYEFQYYRTRGLSSLEGNKLWLKIKQTRLIGF